MYYMVLYRGGACGTWLTWLVNQHKDFPNFEKRENIRKNITVPRDISCLGADWHTDKSTISINSNKSIERQQSTWTEYLEYTQQHVVNHDFKHLAYKIIPNHSATIGKNVDSNLLKRITSEVQSKIILCNVDEVFNNEISRRWNILRKEKEDVRYIRKTLTIDSRTNFNTSDYIPYGIDVYKVDVGKLIIGDSEEYNNLCKYIEQEPLSNFKELADEYRTKYFR